MGAVIPRRALIGLLCLLSFQAGPAGAQFSSLETRDVRLIYFDPSLAFLAPYAARCFENSMRFQRSVLSYEPSEKVTVLLSDFGDSGNAGASAVPRNLITVDVAPLSYAFETVTANERMNLYMNHELVHVATWDAAVGSDRFFRGLFGGKVRSIADHPETILYAYLTTPRDSSPRWYTEGIAVFLDTWMAGGIGRAQGAYDEMVFRSMVRDGSRFYDPLGLVSEGTKIDFQTETNSYLYGTRFMTYLAYRYSPQSVLRWVFREKDSKAYYASQFESVFGIGLEAAWRDWTLWERGFQEANLEAIRRYPVTEAKDLSDQALGSISRAHLSADRTELYAAFNYPGTVAHVGAVSLADGSIERIIDVKGPSKFTVSDLAYDPGNGSLFYTADTHAYRDLRILDPIASKARTLITDARVGDLVFDKADRSLWGIRHFNGISTLVRIPAPYSEWKHVHSWPYGETVYDIDVSPDGTLLSASVGQIDGRQSLRVMKIESLLTGDTTPAIEHDFGTVVPSNFVFSPDGRYLYGSSYYTGVSNIFRFEIATGALEAMSNSETGFFRPIPLNENRLIVFRYSGEGFVPATIDLRPIQDVSPITLLGQQIVETHPVLKEWNVGSPAAIPLDSLITRKGKYRPLAQLAFESAYPVVQGYKDFAAYGLRLNFSDPLFLNRASLTASYSPSLDLPESERYHLRARFERYEFSADLKLNAADFYDLFGPTKTSLKGHSARLGYHRGLVFDDPRRLDLDIDATYYGDLERLPDFQNVPTDFDSVLSTRAHLNYKNLRHSLGHVDEEKGLAWSLAFAGDRVEGKYFPKFRSDLDLGFALPIRHSSVWLRSSAGYSPGEREEPFANFFFGGFGNNWVDHQEEKRYREWYGFPGVELNEIQGRNYVKSMLEWNLPPIRFRRAGTPGFFLTWARPALFASTIATNLDERSVRRVVGNAGAQLDFRFSVLSRLDMTLSVGHAVALEEDARRRHETMVSLKVLR